MEIKEVAQKLCDAYNASRPIYGNNAEIFGNTTPIKADYEKVYKFLVYARSHQPLLEIVTSVLNGDNVANTIDFFMDNIPEEYQETARLVAYILSLF
jgi:hypothetical protein